MSELFTQTLDERIEESFAILDSAIAEHEPSKVFACFSGGTDSLTTALLLSAYAKRRSESVFSSGPLFTGCLHINTGISIPAANEYTRRVCHAQHWPLIELHPTDKSYEEFVLENGFPGPAAHRYCYVWLKERALKWFITHVAKNFWNDRVMLVTGVRLQESKRRMGQAQKIQRDGCQVWVAPLLHWSKLDCMNFISRHDVEISPVSQVLHMSGECLCGAFAENETTNELEEIRLWYPAVAERLDKLQEEAKAAGVHCKWGTRPPEVKAGLSEQDFPLLALCQQCDGFMAVPERETESGSSLTREFFASS